MSRFEGSIPGTYFNDMYAADPDPWRFAASPYERDKYAATLEALPRRHYSSAFEVGCSIGVLTRMLATRCDGLLSVDVAPAALAQAARRCADLHHVTFDVMRVPDGWPDQRFDLILLSEVVYYLNAADVDRLAAHLRDSAAPGCDIVLVHWLGATNYPLTGDEAAERLIAALGRPSTVLRQTRTDAYRLDVIGMR